LRIQQLQTEQWWVRGGLGEIHFLHTDTTSGRGVLESGGWPGWVARALKKWKVTLIRI